LNPTIPILLSSFLLIGCDPSGDSGVSSQDRIAVTDIKQEIEVVQRYISASKAQENLLRGVSMEVDIHARLPKLNKEGTFHALRHISKLGKISYVAQAFTGDNTIKKDVIARYLSAETQTRDDKKPSIAITPANYKFKDKGLAEREGRNVRILQVTPRKKRVGLFKGEIWLDPETHLPVREHGRFVKNPSVFLKKVDFVRDYEIVDGLAIPKHIQSVVETRLVGKAELTVNFSKFNRVPDDTVFANSPETAQQNP
jgi:hypothetical protein